MPILHLVRHGQAAAGWSEDRDPPLNEIGRAQADALPLAFAGMAPLPLIASPLMRCRQTAAPLARAWQTDARIEPAVRELPSPIEDLAMRGPWLQRIMAGTWTEALASDGALLRPWRDALMASLAALGGDTVVVSHFIAINVVVGAGLGDDRVTVFRPDNTSITEVAIDGGRIALRRLGRQAETRVTSG